MPFKFLIGKEENLPERKALGHVYACSDTGNLFFDFISSLGKISRMRVNADKADKLRYMDNNTEHELLPEDIATKEDIDTRVALMQGYNHFGEILGIDANGNVAPMNLSGLRGTLTWGALVNKVGIKAE